jgi:hypothetical protein
MTEALFSPATSATPLRKDTPYGQIITKDGNSSHRKIDAAVAAVVALERAESPGGE